jgi:hypothetical protein
VQRIARYAFAANFSTLLGTGRATPLAGFGM